MVNWRSWLCRLFGHKGTIYGHEGWVMCERCGFGWWKK
jgi:hypothetical protein